MFAPKSFGMPFSKSVHTNGKVSPLRQWGKFSYQVKNIHPKNGINNNMFLKGNPKYLWIDFPNKKGNSVQSRKTLDSPNDGFVPPLNGFTDGSVTKNDVPNGDIGNSFIPVEGRLQLKPEEVNVVTIQPNKPLDNAEHGVIHGTHSSLSRDLATSLANALESNDGILQNDALTINDNIPNSVPIVLDKIQKVIPLTSDITTAVGGELNDIIVSDANGHLSGMENGNPIVSVRSDSLQIHDASSTGNVLVKAVSLLGGDISVTNKVGVSLDGGEISTSLDGSLTKSGIIQNDLSSDGNIQATLTVGSGKLLLGNDIGIDSGESRSGGLLSDVFVDSNGQGEIIVAPADPSRVRKIHQPLAKPISLMLTIEPFGPGPYGTCRAPSSVVCGVRYGWEHVEGMAAWCKQNCVVFMYTSYCDDDRCQCECV